MRDSSQMALERSHRDIYLTRNYNETRNVSDRIANADTNTTKSAFIPYEKSQNVG